MATNILRSAGRIPYGDAPVSRWTRIGVPLGGMLFVAALAGSAAVVPQLRLLHLFQALIYVAVIYFSRRNNVLAFGAGVAIAVAWNSLQLFITHNAQIGLALWWSFLHTGVARRIDTMMVTLGTLGHFVLIVACLGAFLQQRPNLRWGRFLAGGVIVLAYFAVIVATMLPH
jgi:hypothetical protein